MKKLIFGIMGMLLVGCQANSPTVNSEFDCEANKYSLQLLDEGIFDYCVGGVLNQPERYDPMIEGTWNFDSDNYQMWTIRNSTIAIFYQDEGKFVAKVGAIDINEDSLIITTLDDKRNEVVKKYQYEVVEGEKVGTMGDEEVFSTYLKIVDEENQSHQAVKSITTAFDPLDD